MKFIKEIPKDYDRINNLSLRSAFEDTESEPMFFTHLKAEGYVGNNLKGGQGDDTWAIDQYCEDGEVFIESYLYASEQEYREDCEILQLVVFKVLNLETKEIQFWSIKAILEEINRDRSSKWTDYTEEDWVDGWMNWVEGEFYSILDKNNYPLNNL